jgi:hypothetical protein
MAAQRDIEWLKGATPEQIDTARNAGELNAIMGRTVLDDQPGQKTVEWLNNRPAEEVVAAYQAGELDTVLGHHTSAPAVSPTEGVVA